MSDVPNHVKNGSEFQTATLGGGCFWCLDAIFRDMKGVEDLVVGYAGGTVVDPSYEQVCTGSTGHAEVVQIRFDPAVLPYEELLTLFFTFHDPTTLNRQGPDVGSQYRSIVLTHNEEQNDGSKQVIRSMEAEGIWKDAFVTEVVPFERFYPAEEVHQRYFEKNPDQGYCRVVIAPKVLKFRAKYGHRLKTG